MTGIGQTQAADRPRVVVFSQLYPRTGQEGAGLFVHERMRRVAEHLHVTVVVPQAWFPFQGLIRRFRPHFRPPGPSRERLDGVPVLAPRWLSVPGLLKGLDGWLLALSTYPSLRRLQRKQGFDVLDAHFGYPDGYAAVLLGRWLGVPVTVTLRGNEAKRVRTARGRRQIARAVQGADRVFTVADALRQVALEAGADPAKVEVVPNGVDTDRFHPEDQGWAREQLDLPQGGPVLVSVGTLVERKGFHRVMAVLPQLRQRFPDLRYLIVGGAGPEGGQADWLRQQAIEHDVNDIVHFLGPFPPDQLRIPLSAADLFVLATSNEGWANVFLEAMACGLPVITTDVGGNKEVVASPELGRVVPFGDAPALARAIGEGLEARWDPQAIREFARDNGWAKRVATLTNAFALTASEHRAGQGKVRAEGDG